MLRLNPIIAEVLSMAKQDAPLTGEALIKEVCRRIRVARSYWDAHNNAACRGERDRAACPLQHIN
ncbi:hypothetical protein NIES2100_37360 [Calothrix sp. NIES-2100]|nr:hypothetical protein NIES2100_37360 [Calothrix sp. NIES-2100]